MIQTKDHVEALRLQVDIQAEVARVVTAEATDLGFLLTPVTEVIADKLGADAVGLWVVDEETKALHLVGLTAGEHAPVAREDVAIGDAYTTALATAARPSVFFDPPFDQPLFAAGLTGSRHHTAVCPLVLDGHRLVGVLGLAREDSLDPVEESAYASVSDQVALAVEKGRAVRRLREREDGLDILMATAPDGVVVMDVRGRIVATNPGLDRIFGYESAELIGQDVTVLMPERFRARHAAGVRRYRETGEKRIPWSGVELAGLHKDGTEFPIEISFGEYTHEGERVFTGFIRDISDRKLVEGRERRRRRVMQTAAVYLGSSLVALEAADLLVPLLPLPDWTLRGMVLLGFLCFPVALGLAWTLEASSAGRWRGASASTSGKGRCGRWVSARLAWIGVAGLLGGVALAPLLHLGLPARQPGHSTDLSIAVLPFEDVSDAEAQPALGLTDDVVANLMGLPDVRVSSRTSVLAAETAKASLPEVARELDVSYVLEGSIRRSADRIRVAARLVKASSGEHAWVGRYERDASDPFVTEGEVAREIARGIAAELIPEPKSGKAAPR